jgi:universal stress protein A
VPTALVDDRGSRQAEDVRSTASILCPVDFSDESLAALRSAATIARRSGARLVALHVADGLLVTAAAGAYHTDVVVRESTRALGDTVDQIRREAGGDGLETAAYVVVGEPTSEICRFCSGHDIDLIVMGSHQMSGYHRLFFGSVADGVLRHAPAPVLVIPPHANPHASTAGVTLRREQRATVSHH